MESLDAVLSLFNHFIFMCMSIYLHKCKKGHHLLAWCLWRLRRVIDALEQNLHEPPCWCREPYLGPCTSIYKHNYRTISPPEGHGIINT